jgi:hypothetical protein
VEAGNMKREYTVYQYKTGKRIRRARNAEIKLYFDNGWCHGEGVIQGYKLSEDLADWGTVYIM